MIETPEQATPAWVTSVLRASGRLAHGSVLEVERRTTGAFNSTVTHLHLTLEPNSDRAAPRRLVLKLALADEWARRAGAAEVAFYQAVGRRRLPMLARCVAAEHDPETGRALLLLDDLDLTHDPAVTRRQLVEGRGVPDRPALDAIVDALAALHAAWWGEAAPAGIPEAPWLGSGAEFARFAARSRAQLDGFQKAAAGRVSEAAVEVAERTVLGLHHRWAQRLRPRAERRRHLTLVHGDCYLSNWLVPRPEQAGEAVAVDFQQVHLDAPGEDLAFLVGTFWTAEQRARHEDRCLRRYLERLDRPGYGWAELLEDYRWGLERMVVRTVWEQHQGVPDWYWRPKIERVAAALAHRL